MIVTPDFPDHWKTQMLLELLKDSAVHGYLLRLWAHCQNRKTYLFESANLNPSILKALTRSPADAEALWAAFIKARFLKEHTDGSIEVHGFYDANKKICSNWENGEKGGRPRKGNPIENPPGTHSEPKEEKDGEGRKERIEKQEENGEEELFSPAPRKQAFWHGKDYSEVEVPEVKNYEDILRIKDPIIACMSVSGDHSVSMYGFLVKGLCKCLDAGLSEETLRENLIDLCTRLFGQKKNGERTQEQIAPALVAEMRDYFERV